MCRQKFEDFRTEWLKGAEAKLLATPAWQALAWLWLPMLLMILVKHPLPPDDLLRHMTAYLHGYNYGEQFIYASLPNFDPWFLFDVSAGFCHITFGQEYAAAIIQIVLISLYIVGVSWLMRGSAKEITVFVVSVAICLTFSRIMLARP